MAERHTRQGTPVRERTQMGDHLEDDARDWPVHPSAKGGSAQRLRTLACPGCWCGLAFGHDWPGKAEGSPHPREAPETWQDAARRLPGGRS